MLTDSAKRQIIHDLIDHVTCEVAPVDEERRYDELLDELYNRELPDCLSGLSVSQILKEMSPTDYRCGKNDFFGTDEQLYDIGGEYYDRDDVEAARDALVDELESELVDVQAEADDEERTDESREVYAEQAEELQERIDVLKAYVF